MRVFPELRREFERYSRAARGLPLAASAREAYYYSYI
jgi:hypothetical protein